MAKKKNPSKTDIPFNKTVSGTRSANKIPLSENDIKEQKEVLAEMVNQLNDICDKLSSNECEIEEVYRRLSNYDKAYHRVLYSAVSDYIFDVMSHADLKTVRIKTCCCNIR